MRGVLPRRAAVQHGRSAHSPRAGASCAEKVKKKVRTGSPDRVFVMKNRAFVEFISKIRAACLFLHIANKKLIPMRIKFRTSRPMQTPRDISYTGNPTGGTTAYPAVLPAAHEATENSDNIFYRTIRTVMKKQLICLLASAGLLAAGCSTENAPETTGYGTLSVSCTADNVDRYGCGRFRPARSARSRGFLAHGNGRNGHAEMGYAHRVRAERNRLPDGQLHRRDRPRRP